MTTTSTWIDDRIDPDDRFPHAPGAGADSPPSRGRSRKQRDARHQVADVLRREARHHDKEASHHEKEADRLRSMAEHVEHSALSSAGDLRPLRRRPPVVDDRLVRLAQSGVVDFFLRFRPDGWADAHVNGIDFVLPPTRAKLLWAISIDNGRRDDRPLVGWKTIPDVLAAIEKRFGRRPTQETLAMWKTRLLRDLDRAGLSRVLVVRSEAGEIRFALRRDRDR